MIVKAAKGLKVPMEKNPRGYITDDAVFKVENTAYYARRISDGDLLEATEKDWRLQLEAQQEAELAQIKLAESQAKAVAKVAKATAE